MIDLTEPSLLQVARLYHPTGFPVSTDTCTHDLNPYQRTPEYERLLAAWDKAMAWPEWTQLLREMRVPFGNDYMDCTQPRAAACRRCCVYVETPLSDGARRVIRVAVAASVLAPLYVTYCTQAIIENRRQRDLRFSFEPLEEVREHTAQLAALTERVLGYQAFPVRFANVPVPGIRVDYLYADREPTLLDALFDSRLESLF